MQKIKSMIITKATAEVIRAVNSELEKEDKPLEDLLNEKKDEHGSASVERSADDTKNP